MNIIRDGVILAVYTFAIVLSYIFLSTPLASIVGAVADAGSEFGMMATIENEVYMVFGICCALAVLIPTIIFVWMALTTRNEEYPW